jgi:hypothetical protein
LAASPVTGFQAGSHAVTDLAPKFRAMRRADPALVLREARDLCEILKGLPGRRRAQLEATGKGSGGFREGLVRHAWKLERLQCFTKGPAGC